MKEFGLIIKLVLSIVLIMFFGNYVPEWIQRGFFTASILLKETLVFAMPLIVFGFIFSCLSSFQKRAPLIIVMILTIVTLSNFLFTQVGFVAGDIFLPHLGLHAVEKTASSVTALKPFFVIPYPKLTEFKINELALLLGILFGFYSAFCGNEKLATFGESLKHYIQLGLTKVFIPLVPLYVIGFLFKLQYDGSLMETFAEYGPIIGLIVGVQSMSILLFYFAANTGNIQGMKESLKNVFPSGLVALSTMSSAATMPLTLEAAEKNTKNKALAQVMIPATANIHHVGDSVGIPILMAAVLAINGLEPMSYGTFLVFSMYYMVAKYGVASVPGGEAFILLPLLEAQFGFTDSMSGLLTTLYIMMDPFGTVTNVLSNGALAIFMDKVCGRMKAFQHVEEVV